MATSAIFDHSAKLLDRRGIPKNRDPSEGNRGKSNPVTDEQVITYIGQLSLDKGVHCLIAALPAIAARVPGAHLLIIGEGVAQEALQKMVAALEEGDLHAATQALSQTAVILRGESWLTPVIRFWEHIDEAAYLTAARSTGLIRRVTFTGHLPHDTVARVLPEAELLVIPSLVKEAFPLVSVEALACGVLPLGPYQGGLMPLLDELTTILGLPDDLIRVDPRPETFVADLADKVVRLLRYLATPGIREQVTYQCRTLAVQKYDWERVVDQLERVYHEVGQDGTLPV